MIDRFRLALAVDKISPQKSGIPVVEIPPKEPEQINIREHSFYNEFGLVVCFEKMAKL